MPINHRTAPRHSASTLHSRLQALVDNGALVQLLDGVDPMALQATEPHPVYTLALDDIRAGNLVGAATLTSWRFLLIESGRACLAAEHADTTESSSPPVQVTAGDHVQGTVLAVEAASKLPEVTKADYELRILRVPSLYLFAVWLHGPDDLFVPVGSTGTALAANTMYREPAVLSALQAAASQLPTSIP